MQARARQPQACILCQIDGRPAGSGSAFGTITASVGIGGRNAPPDVLTVQYLLSAVPLDDGGPAPPPAPDGVIGWHTSSAIAAFQKRQGIASDGRVDPGGPTLANLNELARGPQLGDVGAQADWISAATDAVRAMSRAVRTARLQAAMPELHQIAKAGETAARSAALYLDGGGSGVGFGLQEFRLADLHFAFGKQPQFQTRLDLRSIGATFVRVSDLLMNRMSPITGGEPLGASIFEIDPTGDTEFLAYSPKQRAASHATDGIQAGCIYLCDGIDRLRSNDLFLITLVHELVHFVDDESGEGHIEDYGYGDQAMTLPHPSRMHNADTYAMFAFHAAFGRVRLVSSHPPLAAYLPP